MRGMIWCPARGCPQASRMFALLQTRDGPRPRLVLTTDVPRNFEHLIYFVRDPNKLVTMDNIADVGVVRF